MNENSGSFDVPQKLVPKTLPNMSSLNQTGDIGHNKTFLPDGHYPQMWFEGGEWVVGNFRARFRNDREQGRFAGIRKAHQPYVGNAL